MKHRDLSLIIGADGLLGSTLTSTLKSHDERFIGSTRRKDTLGSKDRIYLDLAAPWDDSWSPPSHVSVVYLCAAVASQEKCRLDPEGSARINIENTVNIAKKCTENDVFFIFPSTNLVFDGSIPFRRPDENRSPMTEYGRQKAEAEKQLISLGENVAIVRFTKIINPGMQLIRMWCDNLRSSRPIYPFSNYVMSPVPNLLAGEILYRIAQKKNGGIYQVSGPKDITYAEAAYHIAKRLGVGKHLVSPITIEDVDVAIEYNPASTTLDSTETEKKVGIQIPGAISSLDSVFFHGGK
jgi:dTDP-4-dehydrorhamnose reductase